MRIFSGIQPTGKLHLGNYFGAISQFVELQKENECIFSIVDLHAITVPYLPEELQKNILETAISYLTLGIDPEKSIIFVQSQIKEHTELAWILGTISPIGDLLRMSQYKEKQKQYKGQAGAGLLNYPILQAADILLYKAELVPVGEDQKQHVEFARELARRFNKKFGFTFPEPKIRIPKIGAKIMDLQNPTKKMSKTKPEGCLFIFDDPKEIKRKIISAVTDNQKVIKYDPKTKPGISNLLVIYSLFSKKPIKKIEEKFKDGSYERFKKSLSEIIVKSLEPFWKKRETLLKREVFVKEILEKGRQKAQIIAQSTIKEVKEKMGLI
jgi:tryptophanyl-tRNA synthetase